MDLYFSPLACSMATRIALYEAGLRPTISRSIPRPRWCRTTARISAKSTRSAWCRRLRTDDGTVLTENAAILQYVADRFPKAGIGRSTGIERSRLHQWLCFIGTELHKGLFVPLLDKKAPPEVKTYVLEKNLSRLDYLENYLKGRDYSCSTISAWPTPISSPSSTGPWRRRRSSLRNGRS